MSSQRLSHNISGLFFGKKRLCQEVQDQIDPYLATFYDIYSMTSYLTQPFVDPLSPVPNIIDFKVRTSYISEGEEDNVKVSEHSIKYPQLPQILIFSVGNFGSS